ncbi:hypothetical protein LEP1GSC128_1652 [Leptospira borgpetersenii str. 200801926]|uniref:Uncharacterized protein n=3 Tax=Leptospira borgpetersenii TaxID=174 RepID=M3GYZ2_LEPBO|nr:hypothetical protein LEP1GSC128_1652 [Leptospira borgpetersenii str. 200801926]EMG00044.1 hypothetical protein LEP1GSC123_2543 [Leptospira borgpetersenii str. 200701203]EMK10544.1 hypothetical protein LEP1GSC066_0414 [Leptospira sp. serovar Kenya str. Sh9]EMN13869.1 hypothetical protein LEP1GSC055_0351 [Leptospira borgpetersenii str. Brem 307]EMN17175.1 hypothetical protein LEP1GSC056_0544 [Leptospira borgpetersenii str. Brem 328]
MYRILSLQGVLTFLGEQKERRNFILKPASEIAVDSHRI